MRKVGIWLTVSGIILIVTLIFSSYNVEIKNNKFIEDYIENTKIVNSNKITDDNKIEIQKQENENSVKYTAILEIPKINLKRGVVNVTTNFNSINYAISVDNNSRYPNEFGNFILYAHSGNCYFSFFKYLNDVELNDLVYVYYNGIKYEYIINDKYEIKKTGKINVIDSYNERYITLITCISGTNKQVVLTGKIFDTIKY